MFHFTQSISCNIN